MSPVKRKASDAGKYFDFVNGPVQNPQLNHRVIGVHSFVELISLKKISVEKLGRRHGEAATQLKVKKHIEQAGFDTRLQGNLLRIWVVHDLKTSRLLLSSMDSRVPWGR